MIMQCPATMCPLIAPDGSPWTGEYGAQCPGHDREEGGCAWWSVACSTGGVQAQVAQAIENDGRTLVIGPNKPRRALGTPKTYDCPKASVCRWQEQADAAGGTLCPPRYALAHGADPRVALF